MSLRFWQIAALGVLPAVAAPPLTTIQDVLYKADGTRFSGTLTISWSSFQAVDNSAIVTQSSTVKVVDGNLRVQLVATTASAPPSTYTVRYNSDGRVQFQETWSVPSSAQPLRVRDVRTSATAASDTASGPSSGPVQESGVVGLIADLGARPLKGPSFAAGRVAVVDAAGMLASAIGNSSDCVRVDGSSGPCGEPAPGFVDNESPAGIVDGANTAFGLSAPPDPVSSLAVYRNGILQKTGQDYSLTGNTLQFVTPSAPQPGDTLLTSYRVATRGDRTAGIYSTSQVLCSGAGSATNSPALTQIGSCQIAANLLQPGDRLELRFDAAHQGSGVYSIEVRWGTTTLLHRDAAAGDFLVAVSAEGAILPNGAQLNTQSWGTVLPFSANTSSATDSVAPGLTIGFYGATAQTADTVALANFTVVRIP